MQKNKKILISVTILTAAMILMAGTFAWQQMVHQVNEFIGVKTDDIILHDDFDPNIGKKDVYVENPNKTDLFIRVKLNEVMSLTDSGRITDGWLTHIPGTSAADCGHSNIAGDKFHDYFTWTMGGWKYYMPGGGPISQNINNYDGSEPGVKQTPNAQVIRMIDYIAMTTEQRVDFTGWIYDADGYAYWSQPLGENEATGLLLHGVATNPSLNNTSYYYAIDVIAEAVDINDIPMWTEGAASADGSGKTSQMATSDGITAVNFIKELSSANGITALAFEFETDMPPEETETTNETEEQAMPEEQALEEEDNDDDETSAGEHDVTEEDENMADDEQAKENEEITEDEESAESEQTIETEPETQPETGGESESDEPTL